jgi:hypothetical protein
MSGGHFQYAFSHVDNFAYQLEMELEEDPDEEFESEVIDRLRAVIALCRKTYHEMREAEWLFSGDTCPESFLKRIEKP